MWSLIIKKTEHRRIDAFELGCWRRLLRVPWTVQRPNQSILKEINPEFSLEGLVLKLKLQYLGTWCKEPTHWKRPWCWERLRARGRDGWMVSSTQWIWVWANTRKWWRTGKPGMLLSFGLQSRTGLSNWTAACSIHLPFSGVPYEEQGGGCWLPSPCFPFMKEESFTKCDGTT